MKLFISTLAFCFIYFAYTQAREVEYEFGDDYETEEESLAREGRVFPFVAVVRLADEACGTGMMRQGICRTKKQCKKQNGTTIDDVTCGGGYGVCCEFQVTCPANNNNGNGITVTTSGTHIKSPTNAMTSSCRISLERPSSDVCQVRLDFVSFNLAPPDNENSPGDCLLDFMTITGAENLNQFITCGNNNGQHLYLDYGSSTDTITASITLSSATSSYDIMATYIKCGGNSGKSKTKRKGKTFAQKNKNNDNSDDNNFIIEQAPAGCAQYYTEAAGEIMSFNYAPVGTMAQQMQINNEQYAVCIKGTPGASKITYTPCDSTTSTFCISGVPDGPSATGDNCTTDYVDIPGSLSGRYCGCNFPTQVSTSLKPFIMYVNLNNVEVPGIDAPVDPSTGCPLGFVCSLDGMAVMPPAPACGTPEATAMGQMCEAGAYLLSMTDYANTGFCLKYMVT